LQAVKCHTASSEKKAVANPRTIYAILSNILIDSQNPIVIQLSTSIVS
jgi:hypothetical protein